MLDANLSIAGTMVKKAEKKAPTVPESVLKRRKRDEDWAAKKAAAATDARKKARDSRKDIFKRAESYVKEYRDQVRPAHTGNFRLHCSFVIPVISTQCYPCFLLSCLRHAVYLLHRNLCILQKYGQC